MEATSLIDAVLEQTELAWADSPDGSLPLHAYILSNYGDALTRIVDEVASEEERMSFITRYLPSAIHDLNGSAGSQRGQQRCRSSHV